jgi:hypothetical protein
MCLPGDCLGVFLTRNWSRPNVLGSIKGIPRPRFAFFGYGVEVATSAQPARRAWYLDEVLLLKMRQNLIQYLEWKAYDFLKAGGRRVSLGEEDAQNDINCNPG